MLLLLTLLSACSEGSSSRDATVDSSMGGEATQLTPSEVPTRSESPTLAVSGPESPTDSAPAATQSLSTANADVLFVRAVEGGEGAWTFHVTVSHPDTGWEDYADGWDVVTPDGDVLKTDPESPFTRLLLHPHETEQPFTRSQGGIQIPPAITKVVVRAHDLVDGFGGREVTVDLTVASGPDFEVQQQP